MLKRILLITCFFTCFNSIIAQSNLQNPDTSQSWLAQVQADLELREYHVFYDESMASFQSPNRANNIRAYYSAEGLQLQNRVDSVGYNWKLESNHFQLNGREVVLNTTKNSDNQIVFNGNEIDIEYINTKEGIRQNFIVKQAIEKNNVVISIPVEGLIPSAVHANEIHLCQNKNGKLEPILVYKDLKVWDATGRILQAAMQVNKQDIQLVVKTTNAQYPIIIDPLYSLYHPILTKGQASASFGWSVSSAGDVNGDGYSDVIVGANLYDNGHTNEGAAFVYHGSATGLSTTSTTQLESNQANAQFGYSVSSAGDVNGDGYSDVIIGATHYTNGQTYEGAAFVYHGSSGGLSTTAAVQLEANQASASFGWSVSSAGDVNGDGYSDVIVGASSFDNGHTNEGAAFVYHGSVTGLSTTAAVQLEENQNYASFGQSVSSAGDVNGDGYSDVIVGATYFDNGHTDDGAAFVYHGSATGLSTTAATQLGVNQARAYFGRSVSSAGDVNGDGFSDVIVGAPFYDNGSTNEGSAYVYHGSSTGLSTTAATQLEENQANSYFGQSVSSAGDVNGDGYSDVIVGAFFYDDGSTNEGAAFVFHGSASGLSTTAATQLESNQAVAYFGVSVCGAGDVNGDGYSDVILGAYLYDNGTTDEGAAFVYYGSYAGLALDSTDMIDSDQANSKFGYSVSSAGDVNGDGYGDVIIGAYEYDAGQTNEGVAFVYLGTSTGLSDAIHVTLQENQAYARFGRDVNFAGDVNGDGYSDVIVGAYFFDNGSTNEGTFFVYHGSSTGLSTTSSFNAFKGQANSYVGWSVASAGDINGDGYSDVIVGASNYDNGSTDEGQAYIYYGSSTGITTSGTQTLEENQAYMYFGGQVSSAGDINGDGYSDVIVGAIEASYGQTNEGTAFVYLGTSTGLNTSYNQRLEQNQTLARFGQNVGSAGDVNGDGYSDIWVGARDYDDAYTNAGAIFIYHGASSGTLTNTLKINGYAASDQLSLAAGIGDVNGDGYADIAVSSQENVRIHHGSASGLSTNINDSIRCNQANAGFGGAIASAGDVNGDGYSDMIVGAYLFDNGTTDEGAAFVYMGSASGLDPANLKHQLEVNQPYANFGYSVSSAGDVNGDGYSDVIVGARQYDNGQTDEGAAFVYHGSAAGLSTTAATQLEENQAYARFGHDVNFAGDVNGDGYSDVIVGAPYYDNGQTNEGVAFVYHGSSSGLSTTAAVQLEANQASALFGYSVSSAGDVNGDGYNDVIVGSYNYDNGATNEGAAFVYHGSATGLSTTAATQLEENQASAYLGYSVSSAGDVNGDGYSDVIVGAYFYDNGTTNEGAAFVYHGSATGLSTTAATQLEENQAYALFGQSVSSAGDVNGDGYSDVIVGAYYYANGTTNEGAAFVYHGSATGLSTTAATQLEENQANSYFGSSVSSAGDVNGDGYSDVIVGAISYDNGQTNEGAAFVYHGSATGLSITAATQLEENQVDASFGYAVSSAGDVNGDGYSDVIVGAYSYDNGHANEGAAFVYYGNADGGLRNKLNAYDDNLSSLFTSSSIPDANMGIGLFAKSPQGRQKGKLVWETIHEGEPFSSASPITNSTQFTSQSSSFTNLGTTGTELKEVVAKESGYMRTYVRARVKYDLSNSITGQVYGPWRYIWVQNGNYAFLPVEFTYFNAQKWNNETDAKLTWATASEQNNEGFSIQRSADGNQWADIGWVAGNGTTQSIMNYSFIDENPLRGINFYRLQQIDYDGKTMLSEVKLLDFATTHSELTVYPNPTKGNITISLGTSVATCRIVDMQGRVVLESTPNAAQFSIDLSALRNGMYYVQCDTGDNLNFMQPIVVAR